MKKLKVLLITIGLLETLINSFAFSQILVSTSFKISNVSYKYPVGHPDSMDGHSIDYLTIFFKDTSNTILPETNNILQKNYISTLTNNNLFEFNIYKISTNLFIINFSTMDNNRIKFGKVIICLFNKNKIETLGDYPWRRGPSGEWTCYSPNRVIYHTNNEILIFLKFRDISEQIITIKNNSIIQTDETSSYQTGENYLEQGVDPTIYFFGD